MLVKIIGAVFLIISFWGYGFYKAYDEKIKKDFLKEIMICLEALKKKIQLGSGDIEFLLKETISNENVVLENGQFIIPSKYIKEENLLILNNLIKDLGMGDKQSECERITIYLDMLNEVYIEAKQNYKNSSKIWQTLGISAGITVALIII